jgi:hypothetical protein
MDRCWNYPFILQFVFSATRLCYQSILANVRSSLCPLHAVLGVFNQWFTSFLIIQTRLCSIIVTILGVFIVSIQCLGDIPTIWLSPYLFQNIIPIWAIIDKRVQPQPNSNAIYLVIKVGDTV